MKHVDAFTAYLLKIGDEVYTYILAKGATKEDAEDIIQNTFYKLLSMLNQLEHQYLKAWFYRVALNDYIDLQRKKQRQLSPLSEHLLTQIANPNNDIETLLNRDEIIMLLKNIKPDYREIFVLKYYYDLSYEEIATLLSISVETVKKRMYRARKVIHSESGRLRKWINQLKKH